MGFPRKFVAMVKAIDCNASAKIVINGATTRRVKVKRGTRQGDPLSMDKFMIALNPLLYALHNNEFIFKYVSRSNREFLTLAKADDLTLVTNSLSSLLHAKNVLIRFGEASGLEMNLDKTKGFFFNNQNVHTIDNLPFNHWNENCVILGIPFGSELYIENYWQEKYCEFEKEVSYFQSFNYLTLQAKALISKSKLMPKISYIGSVLPIPRAIRGKISKRMLRYIVPHTKTFLTTEVLAANKNMGGIGLANINLHSDIMLVRNVMFFIKQRDEQELVMPFQYYIEYNIGHQISLLWDIPVNNSTVHAFQPNAFYSYVLDILKNLHQLGITKEDMILGKVGVIYKKAVEKMNICNSCPRWKVLHLKIVPNYLVSFNFKVHYNLLPVRSKFTDFRLDNNSRCPFCDLNFETLFHIMGKCPKLQFFGILWMK